MTKIKVEFTRAEAIRAQEELSARTNAYLSVAERSNVSEAVARRNEELAEETAYIARIIFRAVNGPPDYDGRDEVQRRAKERVNAQERGVRNFAASEVFERRVN